MDKIEADWLSNRATQRIFELLNGFESYAVGGCVRDTLLGMPVHDIDISTSAVPEEVMRLADDAGLRSVPTGVEHGTVTVIVEDTPFEITTFRRDIETDGRRAVVAFSDKIEDDARRRDFTMNAIYADAKGNLHDPVDGLPDIAVRRIRFIEDADRRIQEDYLRSLRFFRFSAWYGDPDAGMDTDALAAIAGNLSGLETLSRERVGSEMKRLLAARDPAPAVASMRATGVMNIVLPGADDKALGPLIAVEAFLNIDPNPLRRLAVLGGDLTELRLSRKELARTQDIQSGIGRAPHVLGYQFDSDTAHDALAVSAALMAELPSDTAVDEIERGGRAKFPLSASDLMPRYEGKALGEILQRLENEWVESNFTLTRDELLDRG